jgi:hypothetical protein
MQKKVHRKMKKIRVMNYLAAELRGIPKSPLP